MVINNIYEPPYNKFPPDGPIPVLSKTLVKSKLSQKFWKVTEKIYEELEEDRKNQEIQNPYQLTPLNESPISSPLPPQKLRSGKPSTGTNSKKIINKDNVLRAKTNNTQYKGENNQGRMYNTEQPEVGKVTQEEIEQLKNLIRRLQKELEMKDEIIRKQRVEKEKLSLRMDDLEKMLASFLVRNII